MSKMRARLVTQAIEFLDYGQRIHITHEQAAGLVDALLAELREPDSAMLEAGRGLLFGMDIYDPEAAADIAAQCWQSMCDKAGER